MSDSGRLPLEGIRVLDFTWVGAGPTTTKILGDFGAEVIKIETSNRLDPLRSIPPFKDSAPGPERSGYFANRNSSKRSFALNMKHPDARKIALDLASQSDVCAQSFRPGTMEQWGIGYEDLVQVRPDLVYLAMPMQGEWGPHSAAAGFGMTLVALSGLYSLCGSADRPPVGTGTNYPDHIPSPLHAAFAVLVSLRHRMRTGEGQRIEASQLESTLNVIGPALLAAIDGQPPHRMGNGLPSAVPNGVYPTLGSDRWIAISVLDDRQWAGLVSVVDSHRWRVDQSLATVAGRVAQRDRLDEELAAWTRIQDAGEAADRLQTAGVPAGPVADPRDVLDDPNLRHRHAFTWLEHPVVGPSVYTAPTPRLSRTPGRLRSSAPLLGQDTVDICENILGMGTDEIRRLQVRGVLT